jgi:hypothetical protein
VGGESGSGWLPTRYGVMVPLGNELGDDSFFCEWLGPSANEDRLCYLMNVYKLYIDPRAMALGERPRLQATPVMEVPLSGKSRSGNFQRR